MVEAHGPGENAASLPESTIGPRGAGLVVALVALTPILAGVRRGLPVPGFRVSELLAVILGGAIIVAQRRRAVRRPTWLDAFAFAYVAGTFAIGSIDLLRRGAPFTSDNVSGLVGPFQFLVLYWAISLAARSPNDRRRLVAALLLGSVPVALLAILQSLDLSFVLRWSAELTGSDYRSEFVKQGFVRATGPFPHWQVAAGYLMVIGLVAVATLVRRGSGVLPPTFVALILALDGFALLRTVTAGASAALVAGGLLLALSSGRIRHPRRLAAGGLLLSLVVAGLVVIPRYNEQYNSSTGPQSRGIVPRTIAYRVDIWRDQYLPVIEDRWLGGYGPDLPPDARWKFTESVYVTMLLRGGVVLLLIYLALMVRLALDGRRLTRDGAAVDVLIGSAAIAIVVTLAVTQTIAPYFTTSGSPQVVWILAGLVAAGGFDRQRLRAGERTT